MTETSRPLLTDRPSLQERYAPRNQCFGCGAANEKGLRIRSFPDPEDPDRLIAEWAPSPHHEAFDGVLNGGILGTLLDCHSNWTAAWHLMRRDDRETPPCTVTADFHVQLQRPTPSDRPLRLSARVVEAEGPKATVEAVLTSGGKETARCRGHFVAVEPGHPAYHRW